MLLCVLAVDEDSVCEEASLLFIPVEKVENEGSWSHHPDIPQYITHHRDEFFGVMILVCIHCPLFMVDDTN